MINRFGSNLILNPELPRRLNELDREVSNALLDNPVQDNASGDSYRYSVFPAVITGSQLITANRWKYSWVEHVPGVTPPAASTVACRRSTGGSPEDDFELFAINGAECSNTTGQDYQSYGELAKSDANATVSLLPIGGEDDAGESLTARNPIVMMMELPIADSAFDSARFMFFAANSLKVECIQ